MLVYITTSCLLGIIGVTLWFWRNSLEKDFVREMEFGKSRVHTFNVLSKPKAPLWNKEPSHMNLDNSELSRIFSFFLPMSNSFGDEKKSLLAIRLEKWFIFISVLTCVCLLASVLMITLALSEA